MNKPHRPPLNWQQLLAAYADGELDDVGQDQVNAWLARHPEGYAELDSQRALSPKNELFWAAAGPPLPDAVTWAGLWNAIDERAGGPRSPAPPRPHGRWWRKGLMAAVLAIPCSAAAAAVLAVCVADRPPPVAMTSTDEAPVEEVFQVAAANDVNILSIADADVPQLVVGEPPLNQPMLLVVAGDVRLEEAQPAWEEPAPEPRMGVNDAPLIYVAKPRNP